MAASASAGRWWAVVLAVAVLLGPGRVVANTEGESCLFSYALVTDS
jgi:somatic embryogenesis receptor kinase 1